MYSEFDATLWFRAIYSDIEQNQKEPPLLVHLQKEWFQLSGQSSSKAGVDVSVWFYQTQTLICKGVGQLL